jgi:hypothetical protein
VLAASELDNHAIHVVDAFDALNVNRNDGSIQEVACRISGWHGSLDLASPNVNLRHRRKFWRKAKCAAQSASPNRPNDS